jgi:hypothetical protein
MKVWILFYRELYAGGAIDTVEKVFDSMEKMNDYLKQQDGIRLGIEDGGQMYYYEEHEVE